MIESKKDYFKYISQDKSALGITKLRPSFIGDEIWKFEIRMRKTEYYKNCSQNILMKFLYLISMREYHRLRVKYGFSIPLNVFGPGLSIAHRGTIVVNSNARVGENCRI